MIDLNRSALSVAIKIEGKDIVKESCHTGGNYCPGAKCSIFNPTAPPEENPRQ